MTIADTVIAWAGQEGPSGPRHSQREAPQRGR